MQGLARGPVANDAAPAPTGAAPGPAPGGAQPPAPPQGVQDASPEEQALYNRVVGMAMLAMFHEEMAKKIAQQFKAASDIEQTMGETAAMLAQRVDAHMREGGEEVPGDVMMHAGMEIVEHLGEIAETIGIDVTPDTLERAFYHALDRYRALAQQNGQYGEEQALEDAAMLQQIDQSGAFSQILQSLSEPAPEGGL